MTATNVRTRNPATGRYEPTKPVATVATKPTRNAAVVATFKPATHNSKIVSTFKPATVAKPATKPAARTMNAPATGWPAGTSTWAAPMPTVKPRISTHKPNTSRKLVKPSRLAAFARSFVTATVATVMVGLFVGFVGWSFSDVDKRASYVAAVSHAVHAIMPASAEQPAVTGWRLSANAVVAGNVTHMSMPAADLTECWLVGAALRDAGELAGGKTASFDCTAVRG